MAYVWFHNLILAKEDEMTYVDRFFKFVASRILSLASSCARLRRCDIVKEVALWEVTDSSFLCLRQVLVNRFGLRFFAL